MITGNKLFLGKQGYLTVASDGLENVPWPSAYGDYSNTMLPLTTDSQVTVPIVTNVIATAGNSRVSVSFSSSVS